MKKDIEKLERQFKAIIKQIHWSVKVIQDIEERTSNIEEKLENIKETLRYCKKEYDDF